MQASNRREQEKTMESMMDWPVISTYSRAEAIEDGVLVDVSALASTRGFKIPVAMTAGVFAELSRGVDEDVSPEIRQARIAQLLKTLFAAIRCASPDTDRVYFDVPFSSGHVTSLYAVVGP